jgi:hypothetical protein
MVCMFGLTTQQSHVGTVQPDLSSLQRRIEAACGTKRSLRWSARWCAGQVRRRIIALPPGHLLKLIPCEVAAAAVDLSGKTMVAPK